MLSVIAILLVVVVLLNRCYAFFAQGLWPSKYFTSSYLVMFTME